MRDIRKYTEHTSIQYMAKSFLKYGGGVAICQWKMLRDKNKERTLLNVSANFKQNLFIFLHPTLLFIFADHQQIDFYIKIWVHS